MEGAGAGEKKAAEGPATLKEAAKKRNTDCIYFLASPRMCNKGKSCEYRHSDGARVNPRDCWYWLNGNCLNLKCSFRHPPLDGLIGIPGASSLPTPPSQTVATPQILVRHPSASHNPRKQSATCYFFQKGQCLKGDKCAFVHDPESNEPELTGIPVPRQVIMVSPPVTGLRPCARQKIPGATNEKLVGSVPLSETMPTSYKSRPADEHFQNDSGADEFLKFPRESLQDGRTPYRYSDVATDLGRLMLKGKDDYLCSGREDKYYGREQQRTSSKRYKDEQVMSGERVRHKMECPDETDSSDLRYRLLKQRRLHGPGSGVSSDVRGKPSWKDDRGQASCRKDHCLEAEKYRGCHSSTTPRLQGRITIPARNSHDGPVDSQSERQQGSERHRGGLSLTRLTLSQEGHSDSLKRKLPVHFDADARSIRRHPVRRLDPDHLNFTGPKSLAELKGTKVLDTSQERSNKSIRRHPARRLAPDHLNFTGPKSLAELKGGKVLDTSQEQSNKSIRRRPVRRLDPDHLNFTGPKSLAELKGAKVVDTCQEQLNKSISSKLSLEGTSPTPPNNVLNSESLSPPENTELCSNGNEIGDALIKKGLVPEGAVDGQSTVKSLVQMECDVTNAAEDREKPEQNEESDEVYESDVQMIEEEERENLEQTEETGEVYDYEDDVQWTEDESFSEEYASEFSDDNDDFARKVALLLSGTSYSEIAV